MVGPFDGGGDLATAVSLDRTGGPLGVVTALVGLVSLVVVVAFLLGGLERLVRPFVPESGVLGVVTLSFAVVVVTGFLAVLRIMDRRRRGV